MDEPSATTTLPDQTAITRTRLLIRGAVQGVGFRPCVYRLATGLGLAGWVSNGAQGVWIELEGPQAQLDAFLARLAAEPPPRASIQSRELWQLDPIGYQGFTIRASDTGGAKTALVLPDIAPCADCLRELRDPNDRRYRYPFINCTNCGPRYSIVLALPYDRAATTMCRFALCPRCRAEYEHPLDRRFHAQPNACPNCGPHLELWDSTGAVLATHDAALLAAADAIRAGQIVALKGVGGFQLIVDAGNEVAVRRLRARKHREAKPFALVYPALEEVEADCLVSPQEARLLCGPEAPIMLLRRRADGCGRIAEAVAPGNPCLGVMLPATPLHHLLLAELDFPVVATSGNRAEEPICTDEHVALTTLAGIADLFLVHNRPIARHVDDSVARVALGRELLLRRSRGYAPLPLPLGQAAPTAPTLAVGAQQKSAVALVVAGNAFVSQHIGDLGTASAQRAFERAVADLGALYAVEPAMIVHDLHPDYSSTRWARAAARARPTQLLAVQHHYAHILSCMAENELAPPLLGVAWDGTGYGGDGTVWGGEFLRVDADGWERVAHLRQFRLPGGEAAVREPRRVALSLLHQLEAERLLDGAPASRRLAFTPEERRVLRAMLGRELNAPLTSSAGRLFDGVAALLGLRQIAQFEGQAAMELEWAIGPAPTDEAYPHSIDTRASPMVVDWAPTLLALLEDLERGVQPGVMAARFHNALVEMIVAVARRSGQERVALSGGCFQNMYLLERTVVRLRQAGFQVAWQQRVPPNDGGIALGQIVAAARHAGARRQEG